MSRREGFTLIEVLIVTAVLGLIALIALPKVQSMKARSQVAVLQSDLQTLTKAQEMYFIDHMEYTGSVDALDFTPSDNVEIELRAGSGGDGDGGSGDAGRGMSWTARATHESLDVPCAVFVGKVESPFEPAEEEGVIACESH